MSTRIAARAPIRLRIVTFPHRCQKVHVHLAYGGGITGHLWAGICYLRRIDLGSRFLAI